MRFLLAMTAAVLVVSLVNGPGFAAKQHYVRSFDSCVALAKARGYNSSDRQIGHETEAPVKKFVRLCMEGKQS